MTSAVSSVLIIQQVDYKTLIILTAVLYDYVLTFSKEVEYIWNKPWTRVSTLFILVRYCGLYNLAVLALVRSSFLPGPAKTCAFMLYHVFEFAENDNNGYFLHSCQILNFVHQWTCLLFMTAADFLMSLRVWAMYNRSKLVLGILLFLLCIETVSLAISSTIYSNPKNMPVHTVEMSGYKYCAVETIPSIWGEITDMLQIAFAVVIFVLAATMFIKHSLQMYRATKQWQIGRYMNLLFQQGIFYFLAIFLINLVDLLSSWGRIPRAGWQMTLSNILAFVPLFTLTPRLILSMREAYAHDVRGGCVGSGADTAFGLPSYSTRGISKSAIIFAYSRQDERTDVVEEMPMELVPTQATVII